MCMIKGLMWDMGKVIINFDIPAANRVFACHSDKPEEVINNVLYGSGGKDGTYNTGIVEDLQHGRESFDSFYQRAVSDLDLDMSFADFEKTWRGVLTFPHEKIIRFIHLLHSRGYAQCVISSTNPVQWDEMNLISAIHDLPSIEELLGLDKIVTTYKVGSPKPSPELFEAGRQSIGSLPRENVVYIDDIQKYVAAACALGYKGVFFRDQASCIDELSVFGIRI